MAFLLAAGCFDAANFLLAGSLANKELKTDLSFAVLAGLGFWLCWAALLPGLCRECASCPAPQTS